MPGTPPTSPRFGFSRTADTDVASFSAQVEAVGDQIDALACYFYAPGSHATRVAIATPVDRALYYETDTSTLWMYVSSAWRQITLATAAIPIGGQIAYTGQNDLSTGLFVVADGRLIDSTTYATFDATCGRTAPAGMLHAYNGGVDPGSNKVRIPDKRGKSSRGAINMGTGAGLNDNAHVQAVNGRSGGEVNHALSVAELAAHGHGITDPHHYHPNLGGYDAECTSPWAVTTVQTGSSQGGVIIVQGTSTSQSGTDYAAAGVSVVSAGSGTAHNNTDPYETDTVLVRIA